MDAPMNELTKLQTLTFIPKDYSEVEYSNYSSSFSRGNGKGKQTIGIHDSLEGLLAALRDVKERLEAGTASEDDVLNVSKIVEERKKEVDDRQKEVYATLGKIGKALDKRFLNPVPEMSPLFTSDKAQDALQRTIALHFLRTEQFSTAETFFEESDTIIEVETMDQFLALHEVLTALRGGDIDLALNWCRGNRKFLEKRGSPLEFYLHRSQFMRMLSSDTSDHETILTYARNELQPFYSKYTDDINRLLVCILYRPAFESLPYPDLASASVHLDLEPMFAKEYCASLGMSRQVPLRIVGDIGGGGALARIEKGRRVMRERKSEWSQTDELPIEIPLAPENRYHSIFACPVSKEQATFLNPPMVMSCGHVVAKDSLTKLSKTQGRVKCPYCPIESQLSNALEVHF